MKIKVIEMEVYKNKKLCNIRNKILEFGDDTFFNINLNDVRNEEFLR